MGLVMKLVVLKREQTEKLVGRKKGKKKKEEKEGESIFRPSIFFPAKKKNPSQELEEDETCDQSQVRFVLV